MCLLSTWSSTPNAYIFNTLGDSYSFAPPTYKNNCSDDLISSNDILFSFKDSNDSILNWIAFDPATSQITATPTANEYINLHGSINTITIIATTQTFITLTGESSTFDLGFSSREGICLQSVIPDPSPAIATVEIELMNSATA